MIILDLHKLNIVHNGNDITVEYLECLNKHYCVTILNGIKSKCEHLKESVEDVRCVKGDL